MKAKKEGHIIPNNQVICGVLHFFRLCRPMPHHSRQGMLGKVLSDKLLPAFVRYSLPNQLHFHAKSVRQCFPTSYCLKNGANLSPIKMFGIAQPLKIYLYKIGNFYPKAKLLHAECSFKYLIHYVEEFCHIH